MYHSQEDKRKWHTRTQTTILVGCAQCRAHTHQYQSATVATTMRKGVDGPKRVETTIYVVWAPGPSRCVQDEKEGYVVIMVCNVLTHLITGMLKEHSRL